jgi:hypothetical protein
MTPHLYFLDKNTAEHVHRIIPAGSGNLKGGRKDEDFIVSSLLCVRMLIRE